MVASVFQLVCLVAKAIIVLLLFLPFKSDNKYSAVTFDKFGTFVLGAPEFVMPNGIDEKTENTALYQPYIDAIIKSV